MSTVIKLVTKGMFSRPSASVFSDAGLTQPATAIDWGEMNGGVSKNISLYFKNTGNTSISLGVSASNMSSTEFSSKMTFTPDSAGKIIAVGNSLAVKFTLTIDRTYSLDSFSFDIIVQVSKSA